jgi:hypothetical protein
MNLKTFLQPKFEIAAACATQQIKLATSKLIKT